MARWFQKSRRAPGIGPEELENYDVPSFPAAIHEVLQLIRAEESSNADIALGLASDPGMTVRLLQLVNSAGFGLRQAVADVGQAVQLIGRSSLESVLITAAVRETLPGKSRHGFDASAFWRLSAQRAAIAGALASTVCPARRSICWTAGLLQDLAIPLLVEHKGLEYCSVLEAWREGHETLAELERDAIGVDHTEVALKICRQWEFPEALTIAISQHHEPEGEGEQLPERVVARLRPSAEGGSVEPGGIPDLYAATESCEIDSETASGGVAQGLEEAGPLVDMLS